MSSVGAGVLRLPAAMWDEIVSHARAELPRECCGLIGGPPNESHLMGKRVELFRLNNAAPGLDRYEIDSSDLFRVTRDLDRDSRDVVAIYHSHPTGPARPSVTDIDLAFWPEAWYLICSLGDPDSPDLRAFHITDGVVTETRIEVA